MSEVNDLAAELARQNQSSGDGTYLRRGKVTLVNRATNTYTVTIGGVDVPNVPANVVCVVGDAVDLLFDGPAVRITGIQGLMIWNAVTFLNSWTNYGGGYHAVGYARDQNGMIHLRGMAAGGTVANPVFNLPAAYRPVSHNYFPGIMTAAYTTIQVQLGGDVVVGSGTNSWVSFDGISFPVA